MQKNEYLFKVPVINLPQLSDDEWNRLAYKNHIERAYFMDEVFKDSKPLVQVKH